MKYHSIDYKLTAIKYYKKFGSFRKTSDIFECSKTSLQRWVKKYDDTKNISRKKKELKIVFTNEEKLFIKEYIKKYPNITLKLLTKIFNKKFNKEYHYLSIYYLLKEIKISYKILRKKYFPEKGDDKQELCKYWKELLKYNMKDIISIDESAIYVNTTKERGYSKKGTKAILKTDIYPYKKFNLLLGITYGKIVRFELYKEPIRKEQLINFIYKYILNKYKKKVIILDNTKFHHNKDVKEKIKESKNK
jgi:transposase